MKDKKDKEKKEEETVNPIDEDQIAEHPHLLPYAHNIGSQVVKPVDKGRIKGRAVSAMYEQTDTQLDQIRQQIELLARQARDIHDRVKISEEIYLAEMNFSPLINQVYHLYRRSNGKAVLSMVGPKEWSNAPPYTFVASVRLMSDHTWEIVGKGKAET